MYAIFYRYRNLYSILYTKEIKFDHDTNALRALEEVNASFISYCIITFLLETMNHPNLGWRFFSPLCPRNISYLSTCVSSEKIQSILKRYDQRARAKLRQNGYVFDEKYDVGVRMKDTFSRLKGENCWLALIPYDQNSPISVRSN